MKQEIVVPKFKLPGQQPSRVVRALWVVGGLVVVQMVFLGVVVWKRQSADARAVAQAVQAAQQRVAAEASAPVQAAPVKPLLKTAPTVALATTAPAAAQPAAATKAEGSKERKSHHRSHSGRSSGKMLAKAGAPSRSSAPAARKSEASKTDAIDDLLRRFK